MYVYVYIPWNSDAMSYVGTSPRIIPGYALRVMILILMVRSKSRRFRIAPLDGYVTSKECNILTCTFQERDHG